MAALESADVAKFAEGMDSLGEIRAASARQGQSKSDNQSTPEVGTCEALNKEAVEIAFASIGLSEGDIVEVYPGDPLYVAGQVLIMERQGATLDRMISFALTELRKLVGESGEENPDEDSKEHVAAAGAPVWLSVGTDCHSVIGSEYMAQNPGSIYNQSLRVTIRALKAMGAPVPPILPEWLDVRDLMRPDILDAARMELFEIKSSTTGVGIALAEASLYVELLELANLHFNLGSCGNRGTSGVAPARRHGGFCVWACPANGAIVYEHGYWSPVQAEERQRVLKAQYEGAGVEGFVALGALGGVGIAELIAEGGVTAVEILEAAAAAAAGAPAASQP